MLDTYTDIEKLHDVIPGTARFDGDTVAIGTTVHNGTATITIPRTGRTRHVLVTGSAASGKTALLESLLAGAEAAGIRADLASVWNGTTQQVINEYHALVLERARDLADRNQAVGGFPLRLLLVDDLNTLDAETASDLTTVARNGAKTNVAVVAASQDGTAAMPGGALLRDLLAAGSAIQMRQESSLLRAREIPRWFGDDSTTAGIGVVNDDLFRAWWPGS